MQHRINHLFVYGTLRSDAPNPMAKFLKQVANHVGHATVKGRLHLVEEQRDFIYPALVFPSDPNLHMDIQGDVFELKEEVVNDERKFNEAWKALDEYEGSEYAREVKKVTLKRDSSEVVCNTYVYIDPVDKMKVIENGDFLRRDQAQ